MPALMPDTKKKAIGEVVHMEHPKDRQWDFSATLDDVAVIINVLDFFFIYLACLFTPISVMIEQEIDYAANSAVPIILLLCDTFFLVKFCMDCYTIRKNSVKLSSKKLFEQDDGFQDFRRGCRFHLWYVFALSFSKLRLFIISLN